MQIDDNDSTRFADSVQSSMLKLNADSNRSDLESTLEPTFTHIIDSASSNAAINNGDCLIKDAYGNELLAIGNKDRVEQFSNYTFSNDTLNWGLWLSLYNDSWVFRRAIDKPAQDQLKNGIELLLSDYDLKTKIESILKKHRFDLIQLLQWGALFGGSVGVMLFDNLSDDDYAKPMKWSKLRKHKTMKMYVVDRWYGVAPTYSDTVDNMSSLDFGKPKYYNITFADGHTMLVHHDYILRYEHRTAPKLVKTGQLQGWGYAEGAHILSEMSRDEKLKTSIQSLVDKSLIEVIKMSGMRGAFMGAVDSQSERQLKQRLEMVNWGRNYNSLTFLDKDDEYQEHGFSGLAGLADLLQQNMWLISSALEMQGVLFGDMKNGFSSDQYALERYEDSILGRNENYVRPVIEKFLWVLFNVFKINEKIEFEFKPVFTNMFETTKISRLSTFSSLAGQLMSDGVIDVEQYAKAFIRYSKKGIIDFGFTEEKLNELQDKFEEELEGMSFDEDTDNDDAEVDGE